MIDRTIILAAVLLIGAAIGAIGARYERRQRHAPNGPVPLPPGLILFSAPFCAACTTVRADLERLRVTVTEISVVDDPALIRALDIRTAPTLLRVGTDNREHGRLRGVATVDELEKFARATDA